MTNEAQNAKKYDKLSKHIESELNLRNNTILTKEQELETLTLENNELKLINSNLIEEIEDLKNQLKRLEQEDYIQPKVPYKFTFNN